MKNILPLFLCLLFSQFGFSQLGQGQSSNGYNVIIIEQPRENLYGHAISTTDDARESGRVQGEMQRKYDANSEKIQNTISHLSNSISNLPYSQETISKIRQAFNDGIDQINNSIKNRHLNLMSNSQTSQAVDYLYNVVNTAIRNEIR